MNFQDFINKKKEGYKEVLGDETSVTDSITENDHSRVISDAEYFDTINPDTGFKYDIPMLSTSDPDYFFQYVYFMKLKERAPESFERMMNWE